MLIGAHFILSAIISDLIYKYTIRWENANDLKFQKKMKKVRFDESNENKRKYEQNTRVISQSAGILGI